MTEKKTLGEQLADLAKQDVLHLPEDHDKSGRYAEPEESWREYFWRFLPDKCEVDDCSRRGVRGNENRVGGKIVCDYCYSRGGHLYFTRRWWRFWR